MNTRIHSEVVISRQPTWINQVIIFLSLSLIQSLIFFFFCARWLNMCNSFTGWYRNPGIFSDREWLDWVLFPKECKGFCVLQFNNVNFFFSLIYIFFSRYQKIRESWTWFWLIAKSSLLTKKSLALLINTTKEAQLWIIPLIDFCCSMIQIPIKFGTIKKPRNKMVRFFWAANR